MKYFTFTELTRSATATRLGIDNTPNVTVKKNLTALVDKVLDPLRELWGQPIIVGSGYRCEKLNKAVGGAARSQHMVGQAADIRTVSDLPSENKKLLKCLLNSDIVYDQVINEFPDAQGGPNWIHVSYNMAGNRRAKLTAYKQHGKTVYTHQINI